MASVVLMHIWNTLPMEIQHNYYFQILETFVTMYYLPVFFFISGLFSSKPFSVSKIVKKILPWTIGALFFAVLYMVFSAQFQLSQAVSSTLYRCYWFTIVLTQMLIINQVILRTGRLYLPLLVLLSILLFCLVNYIDELEREPLIMDILAWREGCFYFAFFAMGVIVGKFRSRFLDALQNAKLCGATVTLFVALFIMRETTSGPIASFSSYMCRYPAIFIVAALFHKTQWLTNNNICCKYLAFIGRRTLDIYFLHYFFLPDATSLSVLFANGNVMVIMVLVGMVLTFGTIAMALFSSSLLRLSPALTKILFGK